MQGLVAAKEAFQGGLLEQASNILQEVVEFAPSEAKAWAWQGRIAELQGQKTIACEYFKKAESLLQQQHKLSSDMPMSLPLTRILWQQGEEEAARAMLAVLMLRSPENEQLIQLAETWQQEL